MLKTIASLQSKCDNLVIECYDETGTSLHSDLEYFLYTDGSGNKHQTCWTKNKEVLAAPGPYKFRVKVTNSAGGNVVWLHNLQGQEYFTLKAYCGYNSNTVSMAWSGSTSSYSDTQIVDKTDPKFYLPTLTQTNTNCPLTHISVGSQAIDDGISGMLNGDFTSGTPTYLVPECSTCDGKYMFYIWTKT